MRTPYKTNDKSWKSKAIARRERLHRVEQELKRQKLRASKWRAAFYALKRDTTPKRVKRYSYPLEIIWMSILMHIKFNISLRSAQQSLKKLGDLYGLCLVRLSHTSIRRWSLKFGFYCLSQTIAKGKYVLIIDESIEIGRERLLLLYVVPVAYCSPIRPLQLEDVEVLDLGIQNSWSSDEVADKISQKMEAYHLEIVYGISDNCAKLKKAMNDCGINWISDCTHEIANASKAIFNKDKASSDFVLKMNQLRAKWILSKHQLLIPPQMRQKNRFHQLFIIYKWAEQIIAHWPDIEQDARQELKFVLDHKSLIQSMRQCYELITIFCDIFKSKGIQARSLEQWHKEVKQYGQQIVLDEKARQFIRKMNDYLERQQATLPQARQLLCCSDIIESTFGKYKNKSAKIMTDDVLKIAGYSSHITLPEVQAAMMEVRVAHTQKWKIENTTVSKLALLKQRKKTRA